jgi:Ion channel
MAFAYNLLVTAAMARAVFGPGEVNHHRIAGAVFVYLNVALLFALAYHGLILADPDTLAGLPDGMHSPGGELIHFSFTTLTAIGDGRVTPQSPFARSLADLETVIGHLFPAILLSRLVGLHLSRSR